MRTLLFSVLALAAIVASLASPRADPRTLVLLDSMKIKDSHSIFFRSLADRGHKLTFSQVYDESIRLEKYGDYFYDNLILFAPTSEDLADGIKAESIIAFIDSGRNALIAVSHNVSEPIRAIANECGVDFDEDQTSVIDHLHYDLSDSGEHRLIVAADPVSSPVMLGKGPSAPVLFSGIGHAANEGTRLLTRVLTAQDTGFSAVLGAKITEYPQSAGKDTLLVTALQARNSARVVFSGSLDLFSDKFFNSPVQSYSDSKGTPGKLFEKSGNEEFAVELSKWTFGERGMLRAREIQHRLQQKDAQLNPLAYRIKDDVHVQIMIEEWDQSKASYVPFTQSDVQLEIVMLDPYIRKTMKHDGKGLYSLDTQLPDVYGVYKFRIAYHRKGYSNLELSQQVSVHPYRHNQFERFIDVAYPYYTSALSIFVAFFVFGVVFLYSKAD